MNMIIAQSSFWDEHSFNNFEVLLIAVYAVLITWRLFRKRK